MAFSTLALRHLLGEAERLNIRHRDLLAGVVDLTRFEREAFWIQDAELFEVMARALRMSPLPELGFRLGERGSLAAFGAAGFLITIVPTFRQAILELTRLTQFIRGEPDMFVSEDAQNLSVEIGTLDAPIPVRQCMTEMILTSINQLVTHFAGSGAGARRILLDYPAPSHVARYHELFSCEIHFDQPRAGLVVSREMAERVQFVSQPALAEHLRMIADRELSTCRSNGLVEQVRSQLRVSVEPDPVGMAGVARRLGMSERSLRRQLAAQGVDYRTILKERRQEIASLMLMEKGVAVKHVAHELGYRSTSAFHRAFKRWMGSSPSVYANDAHNIDRLQ